MHNDEEVISVGTNRDIEQKRRAFDRELAKHDLSFYEALIKAYGKAPMAQPSEEDTHQRQPKTALMIACEQGYDLSCLKSLIKEGADKNPQTDQETRDPTTVPSSKK